MEFLVGDDSGLCKEVSWLSEETRRTRIIKKAKQSRSLAVTALCWSGPSGGKEVSEVAVGRACGIVEAFGTSGVVCEAPSSASSPSGENSLDAPLRSFQLPSTPVALSHIGSEVARAHTRSLLCKSWLGSDVAPGVASLRQALYPPETTTEADPHFHSSSSRRLLLAVGKKGHTCVVEWEGSFSTRLLEQTSEADSPIVAFPDSAADKDLVDVSIHFKPMGKEPLAATELVQSVTDGDPFCCRAAYMLPSPVAAASNHPLCHSLLAFGGKENDAKVMDLDYGKLLWAAKNVKPSFLGLRCEVAVTQIEWVLPIHPMVLAVGSARGALRFYDLRCQRRPVLEVCKATQEKRPVTALCVRPTAEVLNRQTDMRVALAKAAETASSAACCKLAAQPTIQTKHSRVGVAGKEAPQDSSTHQSSESDEALNSAEAMLGCCGGKESATLYYADSYGMVYALRVVSGSTLLRLADKTCPKYNPSSYRSLDGPPEAARPAEDKRKLLFAMMAKQRERLSSKENDHPIATAAWPEFQLAAVPVGGFKGAIGAVVGLAIDPAGERLIAVGLGRHAYIFNAKSRKLCCQVFLKQKLTCLLAGAGAEAGGLRRRTTSRQQLANGGIGTTDASSADEEDQDSDSGTSGDEQEAMADSSGSDDDASDEGSVEFRKGGNNERKGSTLAHKQRTLSPTYMRGKRKNSVKPKLQKQKRLL